MDLDKSFEFQKLMCDVQYDYHFLRMVQRTLPDKHKEFSQKVESLLLDMYNTFTDEEKKKITHEKYREYIVSQRNSEETVDYILKSKYVELAKLYIKEAYFLTVDDNTEKLVKMLYDTKCIDAKSIIKLALTGNKKYFDLIADCLSIVEIFDDNYPNIRQLFFVCFCIGPGEVFRNNKNQDSINIVERFQERSKIWERLDDEGKDRVRDKVLKFVRDCT